MMNSPYDCVRLLLFTLHTMPVIPSVGRTPLKCNPAAPSSSSVRSLQRKSPILSNLNKNSRFFIFIYLFFLLFHWLMGTTRNMSCYFMTLNKTQKPLFLPSIFCYPSFTVFLIRVNIAGVMSAVRVGGIHQRQVSITNCSPRGSLRISNQPNIVAFRRKAVKNSQVPRKTPGSHGEPSCCEGTGANLLRRFMKAAKSSSSRGAIKKELPGLQMHGQALLPH